MVSLDDDDDVDDGVDVLDDDAYYNSAKSNQILFGMDLRITRVKVKVAINPRSLLPSLLFENLEINQKDL